MQRKRDAYELRVEPRATTLLERVDCVLRTASGGEDIEMLRDGADAGQQRNLFAFYAVRITAAVPVLVQAADGFCGKVAHTEFGDDAGAAVTAQADHLLVIPMLRDADMKNPGDLCRC